MRMHGKSGQIIRRVRRAEIIEQEKGIKAGDFGIRKAAVQAYARAFEGGADVEDGVDSFGRGHKITLKLIHINISLI